MPGYLPRVSIIIPTYNRARIVARAIESALGQSCRDFEIIVVDDGSVDNTRLLVESYVSRYPRTVRYIYQDHRNVASARNNGIRHACGEIIAFLDSDDEWYSNKLELQLAHLESMGTDFVHTGRHLVQMPGNRRSRIPSHASALARNSSELLAGTANIAMTVLVSKRVLDEVGLFDESLNTSEDLDLWLRIAGRHTIHLLEQPLMISYKLPDSCMTANPQQTYRDRIRVIERALSGGYTAADRHSWNTLLVEHCYRLAAESHRARQYRDSLYWARRALNSAFRAGSSLAPEVAGVAN